MSPPYFEPIENPQETLGKIHISAFRLLFIYLLLAQTSRMSFKDINNHMLNHPLIQNVFTQETIDQYVRTLQVFGCQIQRDEAQSERLYAMADHPLKLSLTPHEAQALEKLFEILASHPIPTLINNYYSLLSRLLKPEQLAAFSQIMEKSRVALDNKVKQYQRYCLDGQFLEFEYASPRHKPEFMLIAPEEVVYRNKTFYLMGTNPRTKKKSRFILACIHNPRQLPSRISVSAVKVPVVFKLTGRLARNYKPYPGELVEKQRDYLLISHTTDDLGSLIRRLMKYEASCEILSPASAKQEMRDRIEHLLESHSLVAVLSDPDGSTRRTTSRASD